MTVRCKYPILALLILIISSCAKNQDIHFYNVKTNIGVKELRQMKPIVIGNEGDWKPIVEDYLKENLYKNKVPTNGKQLLVKYSINMDETNPRVCCGGRPQSDATYKTKLIGYDNDEKGAILFDIDGLWIEKDSVNPTIHFDALIKNSSKLVGNNGKYENRVISKGNGCLYNIKQFDNFNK